MCLRWLYLWHSVLFFLLNISFLYTPLFKFLSLEANLDYLSDITFGILNVLNLDHIFLLKSVFKKLDLIFGRLLNVSFLFSELTDLFLEPLIYLVELLLFLPELNHNPLILISQLLNFFWLILHGFLTVILRLLRVLEYFHGLFRLLDLFKKLTFLFHLFPLRFLHLSFHFWK